MLLPLPHYPRGGQTVWATVGREDLEAERQKTFQLTEATRANISSLCQGPTYSKRYSEAMKVSSCSYEGLGLGLGYYEAMKVLSCS